MFKTILICGDRNWGATGPADEVLFVQAMDAWVRKHGLPEVLIEGCARGADQRAERWAFDKGVTVIHYPAQWDKFGRSAGPRRNEQMLAEGKPDAVIAFHRNLAVSKGTGHMVKAARAAGLPVWVPCPQPQRTLKL